MSMQRQDGFSILESSSSNKFRNHRISVPARVAATNSASAVERVTMFCSLLAQLIAPVPIFARNPEVDLPLSKFPP